MFQYFMIFDDISWYLMILHDISWLFHRLQSSFQYFVISSRRHWQAACKSLRRSWASQKLGQWAIIKCFKQDFQLGEGSWGSWCNLLQSKLFDGRISHPSFFERQVWGRNILSQGAPCKVITHPQVQKCATCFKMYMTRRTCIGNVS